MYVPHTYQQYLPISDVYTLVSARYSYYITVGTITFAERSAFALGTLCPFALLLILVGIVLAYPNKDLGNETTLQQFACDAPKTHARSPFLSLSLSHPEHRGFRLVR